MKKQYKVVALDLDGTVTQHKSKLNEENRNILKKLMEKYQVVFVGAGTCERIFNQLDGLEVDIIGNYGMQFSTVADGKFSLIREYKKHPDNEEIIRRIKKLRSRLELPKDTCGEIVEFHDSGVITFPLLGTKAKLEDKLKYDPNRELRRKMLPVVKEYFPGDIVFIGGTSSYDISPKPFSKLHGIDEYLSGKGLTRKDVIYMGDDYGIGGNDENIYLSDINFVCVDNYLDFPQLVHKYISEGHP